jgi:hypothetical protein
MPDSANVSKLRDRLGSNPEDRLGKALSDLLESPLLAGAVGRAFDAREKATQAQEVAFGALNIPSAADIERLTRRLRSVSHRLEGIEDGVDRLDRALAPSGVEARLSAIESQLRTLIERLDEALKRAPDAAAGGAARVSGAPSSGTASSGTAKGAGSAPAGAAASGRGAAARPARKAARPRATGKPAKRAGARKAEQAKRTAAAKAAKRAKAPQSGSRRRPAA